MWMPAINAESARSPNPSKQCNSSRSVRNSARLRRAEALNGHVDVPCHLHFHPKPRLGVEEEREAQCGIGRDAAVTANELIHPSAGDTERPGERLLTDAPRLEEVRFEQAAGVHWRRGTLSAPSDPAACRPRVGRGGRSDPSRTDRPGRARSLSSNLRAGGPDQRYFSTRQPLTIVLNTVWSEKTSWRSTM